MKNLFAKLAVVVLLIPALANADVKSDMSNASLSLVAVMQNATVSGMSVGQAVKAMIKADASQASAIVATGMVLAPDQYDAIVTAAIEAGVPASSVVSAALVASDGDNADMIVAAAVKAAPGERDAIVAASVRALPSTSKGMSAVAASPLRATTARASGGGASVTAADVRGIQSVLADIESQLVAAGFTEAELTQAVSNITTALQASQQDVASATSSLTQLQADLVAAQEAASALPGLQAQVDQLEAEAATAESASAIVEDAAIDALAASDQAALAADLAAQELAEEEAANAAIDSDDAALAAVAADDAAYSALVDEKLAKTQAELAALGSAEEVNAAASAAEAALAADAAETALLAVEIQKLEATIAALEASAATGISESATALHTTTVAGKTLQQLRNQLSASKVRKGTLDGQNASNRLRVQAQKKLRALARVAAFLEIAAGGKGKPESEKTILNTAAKAGNIKDVTTLVSLVSSLNADKAAQQAAAASRLAIVNAEIAKLAAAAAKAGNIKDVTTLVSLVSSLNADKAAQQAAAASRLAIVNAEIAKLAAAVAQLTDANSKLTKAQADADLKAIADKVDQVIGSISQTG